MKVLKFGGTSVAHSNHIRKVIDIITLESKQDVLAVVVSAFGKTTNKLIQALNLASNRDTTYKQVVEEVKMHHFNTIDLLLSSNEFLKKETINYVNNLFSELETLLKGTFLLQEFTPKTLATVSSFGELLSSFIIAKVANTKMDATYKDSKALIITSDSFDKVQVNHKITQKNCTLFFKQNKHRVTILPGFIASTKNGKTNTLGRGGSDFSAAIYAAYANASELQIWTDVSGMFTANPSIVKHAFPIKKISYEEAMELSHFGAKVIYPPTIQPVLEKKIPIWIKNTFEPNHQGTIITHQLNKENTVKGISHIENVSLITLEGSGMIGNYGISKRLFETLASEKISIVLITQASSEHSICIGINDADALLAESAINETFTFEIERKKIHPVKVEKNLAIVALVGDNMKNHQGLSGKMFSTLGKNNVNVRAIAQGASEKNISAVINSSDAKKALNTLHEQFFEEKIKQLNLFITGVGNVGERLLYQIKQQQNYLKNKLKINVRVIGLSNSRFMIFNDKGIDLNCWKETLAKGKKANLVGFLETVKSYNLRNSIFVDNTANKEVSEFYEHYLSSNIAVVTCNKIACSSSLENYKKLKSISSKYNASFLFETNVGAGLPIIDTLKNLIASGDQIHKIKAVLSGTLNFVFNNFNNQNTFYNVVTTAQEQGYTEPDPKIDLSGIDVARKILILARESGFNLELSDVVNNSFLSKETLNTTNNKDFYASLIKDENHFQQLFKDANNKNCRLKYVAEFSNGNANVGLQHISSEHPFYNLEGSDNIVLFYTDRYPTQPLQIKGAGAGAEVTASGIFADIIRTGKN